MIWSKDINCLPKNNAVKDIYNCVAGAVSLRYAYPYISIIIGVAIKMPIERAIKPMKKTNIIISDNKNNFNEYPLVIFQLFLNDSIMPVLSSTMKA